MQWNVSLDWFFASFVKFIFLWWSFKISLYRSFIKSIWFSNHQNHLFSGFCLWYSSSPPSHYKYSLVFSFSNFRISFWDRCIWKSQTIWKRWFHFSLHLNPLRYNCLACFWQQCNGKLGTIDIRWVIIVDATKWSSNRQKGCDLLHSLPRDWTSGMW